MNLQATIKHKTDMKWGFYFMDNETEKLIKLSEELLAVENDRNAGIFGCTLDELEKHLDTVIEQS